jgi:Spy/CpxP family protein refolding chaperone
MVRRSVIAVAAAAALVVFASIAGARGPGHRGGGLERLERAVSALELDAETQDAVYAVIDEARATARQEREELRGAHEDMRALLDAETPDEEAVFAQVERLGRLETEHRKAGLRALLTVRGMLPADQQEAFRESLKARGDRRDFRGHGECSE